MARKWNGLALQTEFSELLSDTSTTFKARVSDWINDILEEVTDSFDWPQMRVSGNKILTALGEEQDLFLTPPGAPTLAALAGGALTDGSSYKVLATYLQGVSGVESKAGTESAANIPTGANLSITVSAIPVSTNTLVTARKIYLQKDSGDWLLYSTIADNTTVTTTIIANATSTARQPPEDHMIRKIHGDPFLTSSQLTEKGLDQLRLLFQGTWGSGSPLNYGMISNTRILLYPPPSSALTLKFNYYRRIPHVYPTADSIPEFPSWIKPALYLGVKWKGREYRERSERMQDFEAYWSKTKELFSTYGKPRQGRSRVRDVVGTIDGYEI